MAKQIEGPVELMKKVMGLVGRVLMVGVAFNWTVFKFKSHSIVEYKPLLVDKLLIVWNQDTYRVQILI